ncbi:NAD(P)-dependent oxidoreductase [Methylobacterium mesophilicum SR1.6/6]|uniref:NAD(P)-dependent oxidoreductase n=1 Tax=Methylobacterium mesophilicum SR1.6/6 TaxID=908290 RepID=A0A6B9FKI7_9HYPH|nr:NAD(P)-dependent oxidoreductase [Methylobacterium mesophilicum]QGY02459.1 NAD(P)-dependent oxidoreductase [Methylobacterium mesophilicum SR1.6/6]
MADRTQFRLGLVGYGEIGSTLGAGLRGAGLGSIACYDKYAFEGPYADLIQARARESGVTLVRSNAGLAEAADLIVSVTPGASSLESADAFASVLTSRHTFLDFASATPKIKQTVAGKLEATGALLGDGSIEGTPLHGYSMRMLSSGPAGEQVRDLLNPWGMQIEFTGPVLGTASGIKIIRSVLIKGIEALTDEMLLAARQYGIDEVVLASASKTLARPWMDTVQSLTPSGAIHAKRRAEELEMSADAVADAGVEPIMARAVAQRLRWKESLGLKDHFKGVVPRTYREALDAMVLKAGLKPVA